MPSTYSARGVFSLSLAFVLVLGFVPPSWFWPLHYLTTFVHEAGHSLAFLLSGGQLEGFVMQPTGGGFAQTAGGLRPLVLAGGYLGTALTGALLLWANSFARFRKHILVVLGIGFLILGGRYGSNGFTIAYSLVVGSAFLALGLSGWREFQFHLVTLLGVFIGLEAISNCFDLIPVALGLRDFRAPVGLGHSLSDAGQLAKLYGWPEIVFALGMGFLACVMVGSAARFMARRA